VHTLGVHYRVTSHVHLVSRSALGHASIVEVAVCPVLRRAADSPAISVAPECCLADTNAQGYAARNVPKSIARYAPTEKKLEWIFSR
jgi:hypothetical protein